MQEVSSELSTQSVWPSHLRLPLMHAPYEHLKAYDGQGNVLHKVNVSSDLSAQSIVPSQTSMSSIHSPDLQANLSNLTNVFSSNTYISCTILYNTKSYTYPHLTSPVVLPKWSGNAHPVVIKLKDNIKATKFDILLRYLRCKKRY